jgi:hypothetical protein
MNDLSHKMQERLNAWNNKTTTPNHLRKPQHNFSRAGKGDHGDVLTIEGWDKEHLKSQTRK